MRVPLRFTSLTGARFRRAPAQSGASHRTIGYQTDPFNSIPQARGRTDGPDTAPLSFIPRTPPAHQLSPNLGESQEISPKIAPQSFWWCIVTLMTVGYGDVVPVTAACVSPSDTPQRTPLDTPPRTLPSIDPVSDGHPGHPSLPSRPDTDTDRGKLVASITMVLSFIILALPISVIGANFTQQWITFKEQHALSLRAASLRPELEQLNRDFGVHNSVLDEMLRFLQDRVGALDAAVGRLKAGAAGLRAAVVAAGKGGGGEGDEEEGGEGGSGGITAEAQAEAR